jgi:hypothetical protein
MRRTQTAFPNPPPLPLAHPPQRDGSNLYMTLRCHKVDDCTFVGDGSQPLPVPAGWQIADGNADDVRVCGAHAWQSDYLVFANGDICSTAGIRHERPGAARDAAARRAETKLNFASRLEIGIKGGNFALHQDAQGVSSSFGRDVLLRRRA